MMAAPTATARTATSRSLRATARLVIAAVGLTVISIWWSAAPAAACSCAGGPFEFADPDQMRSDERAFVAELLSSRIDERDALWDFRVEKVLSGEFGETVTVRTASDGAACGFEGMRVGESYAFLVYQGAEGDWESGLCSIDSPGAAAGWGDPKPPDPALNEVAADAEVAGDGLLLPVIGGVMLVTLCALALGLTLGRRQKKAPRKPRRNPFDAPPPDNQKPSEAAGSISDES